MTNVEITRVFIVRDTVPVENYTEAIDDSGSKDTRQMTQEEIISYEVNTPIEAAIEMFDISDIQVVTQVKFIDG